MKIKKALNLIIIIICVCLITGISAFMYNAINHYKINSNFVSIPLQFNPDDSSSSYRIKNTQITVYGAFIKGIQNSNSTAKSLVIRALSPLPTITVKSNNNTTISILVENVNPDYYAKSIVSDNIPTTKVSVNTLQLDITVSAGKIIKIEPTQPITTNKIENNKYIIFGDNRDGYNTFGQIIQQANDQRPVFIIDNGDLVFSGKPNQYRLFDKMASKVSATFCTTLGNHDIRGNGRSIYTMLYGPAYYSFNYGDSHFAFLDSSPGWAEKKSYFRSAICMAEKRFDKGTRQTYFCHYTYTAGGSKKRCDI